MANSIFIDRRFCGPPDSGNGGYVCGRLAAFIGGPARVRLQVPPPLDTPLTVRAAPKGVELVRDGTVVAWARPGEVALAAPAAPDYEAAEAAARGYRGFRVHPFPGCFVCGPHRAAGDGLRIFPGPIPGANLVASPWIPDDTLADDAGRVRPEFLWSALDCPGAFSFEVGEQTALLLGEFTASLSGAARTGERCVVAGWEIARDGRKHHTGTALYGESGACIGLARATWFEVPRPDGRKA